MNFANKKSWRRPSNIELKLLASEKKNLWENYGWPTTDFYWSKTNESNDAYYSIGLGINYGLEHGDLQSHSNYGACISIE